MANLKSKYRTHTCGEIRKDDIGQDVVLSGWIARKRDHGGVVFYDLRDNYGFTQVVFDGELGKQAEQIRLESVITIKGKVVGRPAELVNNKIVTGEIEIKAETLEIQSNSEILPFQVSEDDNAPEHLRLKSRFLELRREKLHTNILKRSKIISAMREIMTGNGFTEFQTPILTNSSPEGARDFIVPSRLHPGKFYALPQAPQQFKQLLMVSGFDRYFQIAPCFRDEDARADRSPGEFYQLDLEMSFIEQEDVLKANEHLISNLFPKFSEHTMPSAPFRRIKYNDSMRTYGSDKPDLRNPLEIKDFSEVFKDTGFGVFKNILSNSGTIKAINLEVDEIPSRKTIDDIGKWFTDAYGVGLGNLVLETGSFKGSLQKQVSEAEVAEIRKIVGDKQSVLFFVAGEEKQILPLLGKLRDHLGKTFKLINEKTWAFCWIVDFPFYEADPDTGRIDFCHNPFSMPQGGMDSLLNKNPLDILAQQYDLVCNGYELGSGGIRNHSPQVMYKAFEIAGYPNSVVDEKFGGMKRAFEFGAPPHGGFAHGVERIVMLLCGEEAIRDIIPFPLAQNGEDLMMGAPSRIYKKQLADVHIKLELPKELQEQDLTI